MSIRRLIDEIRERGFITVDANDDTEDVSIRMSVANQDAALVMCDKEIWGIITTNDIAFKVVAEGKNPRHEIAASIMSAPVHDLKITPHVNIEECAAIMNSKGVRHLPLIEDGEVVGIVSALDAANYRHNEEIRRAMEISGAMERSS